MTNVSSFTIRSKLNANYRLTERIAVAYLKIAKHFALKQALTEIRQQIWICSGRSYARKVLHKCNILRCLKRKHYTYPPTQPLTLLILNDQKPLSIVDVDSFGPFEVKNIYLSFTDLFKAWVVLYPCATSHTIILDIARDPSSNIFISSFSRFVSRRGSPVHVISGNEPSFIADDTRKFLIDHGIH